MNVHCTFDHPASLRKQFISIRIMRIFIFWGKLNTKCIKKGETMLIDTLITGFDRNCGVGADSGLWATKGCPLANLVYNEMDPVQIWPGGKLSILKQNLREQIAQMCYSAFDTGFV